MDVKPELDHDDTDRRLVRTLGDAALLAPSLFREVANAGGGNRVAIIVVLVTAQGFGIATLVGSVLAGSPTTGLLVGIILEPLVTLIAWIGGSAMAWAVGARMATPGVRPRKFWPVARALAFAQAPNLLGVLVVLPAPYRGGVWLIARFWLLLSSSAAIRESLGLGGSRTFVTLFLSAAAYALLMIGIFRVLALVGIGNSASISVGLGL